MNINQIITDAFVGKNLCLYRVEWVNTNHHRVKGKTKYNHNFHIKYYPFDPFNSKDFNPIKEFYKLYGKNYENEILHCEQEKFEIIYVDLENAVDYGDDDKLIFTLKDFRTDNPSRSFGFQLPENQIAFNLYEEFEIE